MRPHEYGLMALPLILLFALFWYIQPVPAEDACILFRYAQHLAGGHGIVWNIGEDPVEGATEFLWMLLIASVIKTGAPVLAGAQAIGLATSAATTLLLYVSSRKIFRTGAAAALLVSAAYATSTTVLHAGTAFSTPLYTLLMLIDFTLAHQILTASQIPTRAASALPVGLLALGLTRPEGILFAALIYLALLAARPALLAPWFIGRQMLLLALPGAAYFAWRFSYFGYPLPNTFYVKLSAEAINPESVTRIVRFITHFCLGPLAIIGLWLFSLDSALRRRYLPLLLVPLLYLASYSRFMMIQDVGFRFLLPAYAILLVLSAPGLEDLLDRRHGALRRAIAAALVLAFLIGSPRMIRASGYHAAYDDRFQIGSRLARYSSRGYLMMPTEAGYLPFLSGWKALDPLGLNDETVAHDGLSDPYIDSKSPDMIMFHVDTPQYRERWAPAGADRWEAMTKMMYRYVERRGYRLIAIIQRGPSASDGYHWYYLKPGLEDYCAIAAEITGLPDARYAYSAPGEACYGSRSFLVSTLQGSSAVTL